MLKVTAGNLTLEGHFEEGAAPNTVAAIRKLLPLRSKLVQNPWSGEAASISLDGKKFKLGDAEHESFENHTHYPAPGQLIIYPGGFATVEVLLAWGSAAFGGRMGNLAGNHFASLHDSNGKLKELGRRLLWEGAQDITIEEV